MTAKEQIRALTKCGCEKAILEIKRNPETPLSTDRLQYHLALALNDGFVSRALVLAELINRPLTADQLGRVIERCLELEWMADAVHASRQGPVSMGTRRRLLQALLAHGMADEFQEAIEILDHSE